MTALAAMAASTALPPASRMWAPACEARNCGVETMPNLVTTMERPCPGTEESCCAATITGLRSNAATNARCFMPRPWLDLGWREFYRRDYSTAAWIVRDHCQVEPHRLSLGRIYD